MTQPTGSLSREKVKNISTNLVVKLAEHVTTVQNWIYSKEILREQSSSF
jgi:hypothetical protein